jgi:transcriptional regulator with XRE-family HTH domain
MVRKKDKDVSIGQRVKEAREKIGLTLEEVAHETGYSLNVISHMEENQIVPPVSLLLQLSRVLKLSMEDIDVEDVKASKIRGKSHKRRADSYAYTPLTKTGDDKHLRAYLIMIDPKTEHKGVEYHHDGEEFIYVLKGGLMVQIGNNIKELAKGESIHFNSALHHKLSNPAGETTKLLVVVYTP